ncbi:MAG: DegV family protein, partial [Thermotoga sp.]
MEKIGIVTDSTCNLSEKILKENRIESVSLYIHSQEEYKKDVDILPSEFYQQLKKAVILPTTSQPSSMDFEKVYR